jgi:hypothetical protein
MVNIRSILNQQFDNLKSCFGTLCNAYRANGKTVIWIGPFLKEQQHHVNLLCIYRCYQWSCCVLAIAWNYVKRASRIDHQFSNLDVPGVNDQRKPSGVVQWR